MGFLDGGLAPTIAGAFGWLLLDGQLHSRALADNGKGGMVAADVAPVAIKGMVDTATQTMREAEGFRETDVSLLVLANGLPAITLDHEITLRGQRYHVLPPLALDAAMTHWTMRGRPIE